MRRSLLSAVVAVVMSVGLATPPAAAASDAAVTSDGAVTSDDAASEVGAFVTDGDHVHVSSTPPPTASGHGWWLDPFNKHRSVKATVTVWLQAKDGGRWVTVAKGARRVKSGGGSSRRADARKRCENRERTQWRSVIDVDLIGIPDSPEKAVTTTVTLACGV